MGLHKLEIEVDDETLSRIDAAAARINGSRAEVVVEKLRDLPPVDEAPDRQEIEKRLTFLHEMSAKIAKLGLPGRSGEEIDREIREFREDRKYDW